MSHQLRWRDLIHILRDLARINLFFPRPLSRSCPYLLPMTYPPALSVRPSEMEWSSNVMLLPDRASGQAEVR